MKTTIFFIFAIVYFISRSIDAIIDHPLMAAVITIIFLFAISGMLLISGYHSEKEISKIESSIGPGAYQEIINKELK